MLFTQLTDSKMHGFEVYMGLRNTKVSVFKFYLCNKHCMESTYFCANFLEDFFLFLCFCFLMMGGGFDFIPRILLFFKICFCSAESVWILCKALCNLSSKNKVKANKPFVRLAYTKKIIFTWGDNVGRYFM